MAHDQAHAHDHKGDARAAFAGLIGGSIALLAMVLVVVYLTNRKFEGHAAAAPAHSQSTPSTGAPPATPAAEPAKTSH